MTITFAQAALYAARAVALLGLALALLTPGGREAGALLGLRIADALIAYLERLLGAQQYAARQRRLGARYEVPE